MIAIVNKGPQDDPDPKGERTYELRVDRRVVSTFRHRRGDGLAECLREAAAAADEVSDMRRKMEAKIAGK